MQEFGWILFRRDGKKMIAHTASCAITETMFVPTFISRRSALVYRDLRLGMTKQLVAKKVMVMPL